MLYETTHVCTSLDTGGTPATHGRPSFLQRLQAAALSNPPGQCPGATPGHNRPESRGCDPKRAPCPPCFRHPGADLLARAISPSPPHALSARRPQARALAGGVHQSPRTFGKAPSTWTLALAAEVCWEQGLTPYQVSIENIRQARKRLGVRWQRAKAWITSPDPQYARKKTGAIGSCSWPPSTPTGWWASPMRPGGVGWPTPRGIAGPPKHPCDWWNRSSPREMPSPTPSAARASCGPIPVTSCCALSTAGLSVTSPPLFRRGSVHA
jgi:hypothetical protein